jgi:acetyl-CoA synthetase
LGRVFGAVLRAGYDAVGFMLDCPPEAKADTASFDAAIDAFIGASHGAPARAALIASLPETISARVRRRCLDGGVIPLQGQREALEALALAGAVGHAWRANPSLQLQIPPGGTGSGAAYSLSEYEGKVALKEFGVTIPRGELASAGSAAGRAADLGFPVVIKAVGVHLEHKTEVGGVALNIRNAAQAETAARRLSALSDSLLVEQMTTDGVAEILIGLIVDPQFGQVLVLGAGGVLTELLSDSHTLLPPWTRESVKAALRGLKVGKLLGGYRGKPAGDLEALIDTVLNVSRYAAANLATLVEIDVNPVIVRPKGSGAIAVDVMIRLINPA